MRSFIILAVVAVFTLFSCATATTVPVSDTVCISQELNGSITVRVWGKGVNLVDAIAQARKNAVYEVIFNGIRNGNSAYTQRPLIVEANAREKYSAYFDSFFADGGDYVKYYSKEDHRWNSRVVKRGKNQVSTCVTLTILRPELQTRLASDGLIR